MKKILIIDDDWAIRMLYKEELFEEGYGVVTISGGKGLMELIRKENPDLIVLDIRLGEENGLDILQDIRNTYYDLPVILCTAYPQYSGDLRCIASDYYVVKGSDMRELKFKIKMALETTKNF